MTKINLKISLHVKIAVTKYSLLLLKEGLRQITLSQKQLSTGFTLIETLVVVIMVGILAAIASPSWIAFVSQRRVNAVNDAVLRVLQQGQSEAKRTKQSYSISFKTENLVPKFAVYPTDSTPTWDSLGKGLEIKQGQVLLGTNLSADTSSISYASNTAQTITFDYTGNLPLNADIGNKGLIVLVAIPQSSNPTQVIDATRRCVKITTLLGAMQTGKQQECNAQ